MAWRRPDQAQARPAGPVPTTLTRLARQPLGRLITAAFGSSETAEDGQSHTEASRTELKIS